MNTTKKGLYDAREVMEPNLSLERAQKAAERLISQSAGLALVCSHALDSVLSDDCNDVELDSIASVTSRICYQIWNDVETAIYAANDAGGGGQEVEHSLSCSSSASN